MNDHLQVVRSYPGTSPGALSLPVRSDNPANRLASSSDATPSTHGSKHSARTQRNASHPYARQRHAKKPNVRRASLPGCLVMNDHLVVVGGCPGTIVPDALSLPVRADNMENRLARSSDTTSSTHGSKHSARTQFNASHPYARQGNAKKANDKRPSPPGFDTASNVYRCLWREHFGGNCDYSCSTHREFQTHDRHILTHLPDDNGYTRANFMCKANPAGCCRKYSRLDAVTRHINYVHSTTRDTAISDTKLSQLLEVPWCKPPLVYPSNINLS